MAVTAKSDATSVDPSVPGSADLPPLIQTNASSIARALLTSVSGALVGYGVITSDQTAAFIAVGSSVILWAVTGIWVWVKNAEAHRNLQKAIASPPAPTAK